MPRLWDSPVAAGWGHGCGMVPTGVGPRTEQLEVLCDVGELETGPPGGRCAVGWARGRLVIGGQVWGTGTVLWLGFLGSALPPHFFREFGLLPSCLSR